MPLHHICFPFIACWPTELKWHKHNLSRRQVRGREGRLAGQSGEMHIHELSWLIMLAWPPAGKSHRWAHRGHAAGQSCASWRPTRTVDWHCPKHLGTGREGIHRSRTSHTHTGAPLKHTLANRDTLAHRENRVCKSVTIVERERERARERESESWIWGCPDVHFWKQNYDDCDS